MTGMICLILVFAFAFLTIFIKKQVWFLYLAVVLSATGVIVDPIMNSNWWLSGAMGVALIWSGWNLIKETPWSKR